MYQESNYLKSLPCRRCKNFWQDAQVPSGSSALISWHRKEVCRRRRRWRRRAARCRHRLARCSGTPTLRRSAPTCGEKTKRGKDFRPLLRNREEPTTWPLAGNKMKTLWTASLRGSVRATHPAVPGSNPRLKTKNLGIRFFEWNIISFCLVLSRFDSFQLRVQKYSRANSLK